MSPSPEGLRGDLNRVKLAVAPVTFGGTMATEETFQHAFTKKLQAYALTFPEVTEGASCVNRAFKARKKNFVFIGEKDADCKIMLKLGPSLDAATTLAKKDPEMYGVGSTAWVTVRFTAKKPPPLKTMKAWIDESFRELAPKTLVATLN